MDKPQTLKTKEKSESKRKEKQKSSVNEICSKVKSLNLKDGETKTEGFIIDENYFGEFRSVAVLDQHFPRNHIKQAQAKNFAEELLVKNNPLLQHYLDCRQLQPSNIKQVMSILLEIEDAHTMLPYCRLYQTARSVRKRDKMHLEFEIKVPKNCNLDDVLSFKTDEVVFVPRESTLGTQNKYPIDLLSIHPHEHKETAAELRRHVRTLQKVENDTVFVKKMSKKCPDFDLEKDYDIIFRPNRFNFLVQQKALKLLNNEGFQYIFPPNNLNSMEMEATTKLSLAIINKQICANPEQLQAVQKIVGGANPYAPYIVVGPPGTGKTTTIVEAILQLYIRNPKCHILITTASNSACDTVALKICEHFEKHPQLVELSRERRGLDLNGKPNPPKDILRVFSKSWINKNGFRNIHPLIKKNANFFKNEVVSPRVHVLESYKIIVVTLCTVGRMRTGIYGSWPFTHVFIDEAAATTETEALVAITSVNTNRCRVILSGDTKQLGPVVMSKVVSELGLKYSLMKRLLERECYAVKEDGTYDSTLQTRLRRNYRSHPEILRLFNHLYYKNELIAEVKMDSLMQWNELKMLTNKEFPIIFEAVHGNLGHSKSSQSSYNQAEVNKVIWIVHKLQKRVDDLGKIGIISPYRLQCAKIKAELHRRNLKGIDVGTAELFQGREKPIIIASFVKSFCNLGFVTDPQRLNVILSRAQSLLILVGNPITLQSNGDFKYLIEECKKMDTFQKINPTKA